MPSYGGEAEAERLRRYHKPEHEYPHPGIFCAVSTCPGYVHEERGADPKQAEHDRLIDLADTLNDE